jgi:hypothetical protein
MSLGTLIGLLVSGALGGCVGGLLSEPPEIGALLGVVLAPVGWTALRPEAKRFLVPLLDRGGAEPAGDVCRHCGQPVRPQGRPDRRGRDGQRRQVRSRALRPESRPGGSPARDAKPVFPPLETPAGAPDLGFLIAFEDPLAQEGWTAGVVKAIDDGWEERVFTVENRTGELRVPRGMVFYWWPPPGR